ncbi:hypothetical protein MXL15_22465 [Pseudomonas mosselii]|uniref:hypothetical protein n=1 Tax=Pseudomonas mosselii TaxID=78327 RepID=UPI002DBDA39E|nr:hypothetical protein [Pseudomonas mosselii]MEB5934962.1 hypothetical protein [Pseudomonas mosselii]
MATLTSSFSPRYPSLAGTPLLTSVSTTSLSLDLRALIEWFKERGHDAFRNFQDLIEHLKQKYMEMYFRPTYAMPSPAVTLNVAELHEAVAREVYIESIGLILTNQAAIRLRGLAETDYGWDGNGAEAMSLESLATLHTFLQQAGRFANDFGFFLGYEGEILISWTSSTGALIDMAFYDGRAELCSDTEEQEFDIHDPQLYVEISTRFSG